MLVPQLVLEHGHEGGHISPGRHLAGHPALHILKDVGLVHDLRLPAPRVGCLLLQALTSAVLPCQQFAQQKKRAQPSLATLQRCPS